MDIEKEILNLKERVAALEVQVQEQRNEVNAEKIIQEIANSLEDVYDTLLTPPKDHRLKQREQPVALTEQDLHCIARLLQSTVFADDLFFGCNFCKYKCFDKTEVPAKNYNIVMRKLNELTGVDTSPLCNNHDVLFEKDLGKFLKASNSNIKEKLIDMLGLE